MERLTHGGARAGNADQDTATLPARPTSFCGQADSGRAAFDVDQPGPPGASAWTQHARSTQAQGIRNGRYPGIGCERNEVLPEELVHASQDESLTPKVALTPSFLPSFLTPSFLPQVSWFPPPRDEWAAGGLAVNVNPELGLKIKGVRHVIKLYFKVDRLTKLRIDIATQLMDLVLGDPKKPTVFGVLDVRNAKLFSSNGVIPGMIALLHGEASSFGQIYGSV